MKKRTLWRSVIMFYVILLLMSCAGLHYSSSSDNENKSIITEAQALIPKSSESYSTHAAEVDALKAHIDRVLQMEDKRGMNQATIAMWKSVQKDKENLYDFFDFWKQHDKLSPAMADESNKQFTRILIVIQTWEQRKKGGPLQNN